MHETIHIGEHIRYYRGLRGLSQEQLALQAGINPAFLGHLERGLKSPTVTTLEKIALALDISLSELFTAPRKGEDPNDPRLQVIEQVVFQIKDLPIESIQKIVVILQNILSIEK